jgi:hypothetical protein
MMFYKIEKPVQYLQNEENVWIKKDSVMILIAFLNTSFL